jgi:GNAT superfamily N-acetyltransferase
MKILKLSSYTFDCPTWSAFTRAKTFLCAKPQAIYATFKDREVQGFLTVKKSYYQGDGSIAPFMEIVQLEVHPDYRRKGIGSKLMQRLFADCAGYNFYLECGGDQSLHTFYAKLGFCYFFKNEGIGVLHFMKLIDPLDQVMHCFHQQEVFYPEDNTDYAGCVWSAQEKRFINTHSHLARRDRRCQGRSHANLFRAPTDAAIAEISSEGCLRFELNH